MDEAGASTKVFANCAENVLGDLVMASAPGDGGC